MNGLTLALLAAYGVVGLAVGVWLVRSGSPPATAAAAVVAWPLLLQSRPRGPEPEPGGPLRVAIDRAFERLDDAAGRIGGLRPEWETERAALRDALVRADARLAVVDRILAEDRDGPQSLTDSLDRLRARRERSADEIALVLGEIAQMRVQMGLLALSGDAVPLRDGLRSLVARARALDELDNYHSGAPQRSI